MGFGFQPTRSSKLKEPFHEILKISNDISVRPAERLPKIQDILRSVQKLSGLSLLEGRLLRKLSIASDDPSLFFSERLGIIENTINEHLKKVDNG